MLVLRQSSRAALRALSAWPCAFTLLLILAYDWISLPHTQWDTSALSPRSFYWTGGHGRPVPVELYRTPAGLYAEVHGLEVVPTGSEHIEDFVLFRDIRQRRGMWGLTHETRALVFLSSGDLTPMELAQMPTAVLDAIRRSDASEVFVEDHTVELLQSPTLRVARTLRRGYLHNAFAIAMGALLLLSLALNADRIRRSITARRRATRGDCPACGYALANSVSEVCPECGAGR
jgi:hypothetical protein